MVDDDVADGGGGRPLPLSDFGTYRSLTGVLYRTSAAVILGNSLEWLDFGIYGRIGDIRTAFRREHGDRVGDVRAGVRLPAGQRLRAGTAVRREKPEAVVHYSDAVHGNLDGANVADSGRVRRARRYRRFVLRSEPIGGGDSRRVSAVRSRI